MRRIRAPRYVYATTKIRPKRSMPRATKRCSPSAWTSDIFSREREGIAKGWDRISEIDAMLAPVFCSLGEIPFSLQRYTSVGISSIVAHFQEEYVPSI